MGPFFVVLRYPGFGEITDLRDGVEKVGIQHFLAIGSVEAFDKSILVGFSGLDVPQLDLTPLTPFGESDRGKFTAVIRSERLWACRASR